VIRELQRERGFPLAFENRGQLSAAEWRRRARAEAQRALSFFPKPAPLDLQVHERRTHRGYQLRRISFAGTAQYRIPAFLLVPTGGAPPFPAVVALHDHGGYFYHGKEKLVEIEDEHPALTEFKQRYYQGRSYASELARRGFVVLVIDAFYWGERRLQYQRPPDDFARRVAGLSERQPEYVRAVNAYLGETAAVLNTWLSFCGLNWLGILNHDDRRSLDVLESLPEVDRGRLGCVGLSVGGYRAAYLAGMDSRVRAAVIAGWMTSLPTTLDIPYSVHARLPDALGLHTYMDQPDVASLAAPECALLVQNCLRDRLFTTEGMTQAARKLRRVWEALGRPERFRVENYDAPHEFNAEMQENAFAWLEKWLKAR
jgi:dienelactone hydrolase